MTSYLAIINDFFNRDWLAVEVVAYLGVALAVGYRACRVAEVLAEACLVANKAVGAPEAFVEGQHPDMAVQRLFVAEPAAQGPLVPFEKH